MFWPLIPLIHACAFGLAAVLARLILVRRRIGASPLALRATDTAREFAARCFYVWLPLVDFAFVLFYAARGDPGPMLCDGMPGMGMLRWAGVALLTVALVWVVLAQAAMGSDWRMGVDEGNQGRLLTSGPFARSRHPVYTGIRVTMFAQLLVIGSWPALCLWVASELLVQLQARFEEDALRARHGSAYEDYCGKVRRWL